MRDEYTYTSMPAINIYTVNTVFKLDLDWVYSPHHCLPQLLTK